MTLLRQPSWALPRINHALVLRAVLATVFLATAAARAAGGPTDAAAASSDGVARLAATKDARADRLDAALQQRILALDPLHLSERDVREVLAQAPAPRIINLQGSVAFITMREFAQFLVAMGYPEQQVRNPKDGSFSYSSFEASERLAGMLAWYYERDGMVPMLVGHSQGGMVVIKTLYDLADGSREHPIPIWNPLTDQAEARTTIRDPVSGRERPVAGLRVPYAAAIATGKLFRVLLGQWDMLGKLRAIPDSVEEFTGFLIEWDPLAGTFGGAEPYHATGAAAVRTVALPAGYSHIGIPVTLHLAQNRATRRWVNAYLPKSDRPAAPENLDADTTNILHAAELWYSIKKHWCIEAQRLIRARATRGRRGS